MSRAAEKDVAGAVGVREVALIVAEDEVADAAVVVVVVDASRVRGKDRRCRRGFAEERADLVAALIVPAVGAGLDAVFAGRRVVGLVLSEAVERRCGAVDEAKRALLRGVG